MDTPSLNDIPLRARKRARTRIALVEALLDRLQRQTLDEVQVSALAEAVEISQATFFNHFPTKGCLLTHFVQLWSLRMAATARRVRASSGGALAAVEALFAATAEEVAAHPRVMREIIAHQARMDPRAPVDPVPLAERLLFLPGEPDVAGLPDGGLGQLLPPLLAEAVAAGELPAGSDIEALTLGAASIFFGVPLLLAARQPEAIAARYREQLALLWAGARSAGGAS